MLLLLASLLACAPDDLYDGQVVILVMDGVRPGESLGSEPSLIDGEQPSSYLPETWETLVPQAAMSDRAWNLGTTITAPAHAAMLSGRRQLYANYEDIGNTGLYRPLLPSLLEAMGPGESRVLGNSLIIRFLTQSLWPGRGEVIPFRLLTQPEDDSMPLQDDRAALTQLLDELERDPARLVVMNLHQADREGHTGGEHAYPDAVRHMDPGLVQFWEGLQQLPSYAEDTWLFVVADHGRHHYEYTHPPWRNHGDACRHCRHLPFMVLGPQVREGQRVDRLLTLEDVAATAASLLRVELPWSRGFPAEELFSGLTLSKPPTGILQRAESASHEAEIRWTLDSQRRQALYVDGVQLSSPEALEVGGLSLIEGSQAAMMCFRELILSEADTLPWRARCFEAPAGERWAELPPPEEQVSAFWEPDLQVLGDEEESVWLSYVQNLNGQVSGQTDNVSLVLSRWSDGRWEKRRLSGGYTFPTHLQYLSGARPGLGWLAFSAGDGDITERDRRRWMVAPVDFDGEGVGEHQVIRADSSDLRLESPRLALVEEELWLAGWQRDREQATVALMVREESGAWTQRAQWSPEGGEALGHVPPRWHEGEVLFLGWREGMTQLCRGALDGSLACEELGLERVEGWVDTEESLELLVDQGQADWIRLQVEPPA